MGRIKLDHQVCGQCGRSLPPEAFIEDGKVLADCSMCRSVPEVAKRLVEEIERKKEARRKLVQVTNKAAIESQDIIRMHAAILDRFDGLEGLANEMRTIYDIAKEMGDVKTQHAILRDIIALTKEVNKFINEELKGLDKISPDEIEPLIRSVLGHNNGHNAAAND